MCPKKKIKHTHTIKYFRITPWGMEVAEVALHNLFQVPSPFPFPESSLLSFVVQLRVLPLNHGLNHCKNYIFG